MNLSLELAGFNDVPADSRIYNPGDNIKKILFGIDISKDDLINAKQNGFDLVISHHPPYMMLDDGFIKVLDRHKELLVSAGVDPAIAEQASDENKMFWQFIVQQVSTGVTYDDIVTEAQEFDIPLMNIHLACDEVGRGVLQKTADQFDAQEQIAQLIESYSMIPEIEKSDETVQLICGSPENKAGKVFVMHGAGTNGGYSVANALFEAGVDTVVYIHLFPFQKEQEDMLRSENKGNLIVTGHYGSDSVGINPLINELDIRGIDVVCCNNLVRIK